MARKPRSLQTCCGHDRPDSNLQCSAVRQPAVSGFEKIADYCIEHHLEHTAGALALKNDPYVDDVIHSDSDDVTARSTATSLQFVLQKAGLTVKAYTYAGSSPDEEVSSDGVHVGLVGLLWDPLNDVIGIDVKELFFGKTRRGLLPERVTGCVKEALQRNFTRRNLLGKVAGVFDPSGLVTPVTSRLKLDLHDLCRDQLDWDDNIPELYLERWLNNLDDIQALKEIRFRRTVIPPDAVSLDVSLIVSSDASKSIAVSCVHARCQLLTGKSKMVWYETSLVLNSEQL